MPRPNATHARLIMIGALAPLVAIAGCGSGPAEAAPDLERIYGVAAREIGEARTPVIVIPGILGSKLEDRDSGGQVWGALTYNAAKVADADREDPFRLIALPIAEGVPLERLTDRVTATEALDSLEVDVAFFVRGLRIAAYRDILGTLGVGRYVDETLLRAGNDETGFFEGEVDYAGLHSTCFQHAYDWRRDIAEAAALLDDHISYAQESVRAARGLGADEPVRVDVVAHSMGGLVLRYYLRYGVQPLRDDGVAPELTWAGAQHVRNAVLVGTPNAGSVHALRQLVEGFDTRPVGPNYQPALLGTFPAIYQLLPRARHAHVIDADGRPVAIDDPATWERYGWGLADPAQDRFVRWLLPEVEDAADRRRIAIDHIAKSLRRASALHAALDATPATPPPPWLRLHLFAGDATDTPAVLRVDDRGRLSVAESLPGDGTVTRVAALMDERIAGAWTPGVRSPILWHRVQFIPAEHLAMTRHPSFSNNLLYLLLEEPR